MDCLDWWLCPASNASGECSPQRVFPTVKYLQALLPLSGVLQPGQGSPCPYTSTAFIKLNRLNPSQPKQVSLSSCKDLTVQRTISLLDVSVLRIVSFSFNRRGHLLFLAPQNFTASLT